MKHKHQWLDYQKPAIGYWSKRDCPDDGVYFQGKAQICYREGCLEMRFVCDDPRLQIVPTIK